MDRMKLYNFLMEECIKKYKTDDLNFLIHKKGFLLFSEVLMIDGKNLLDWIKELYKKFENNNFTDSQYFYHFLYDLNEIPVCKQCNTNRVTFKSITIGYFNFCSGKCSSNNTEIIEKSLKKIKQTNLERFGCENPFQNKEIKNKIKQTNLERYGVDNPAKSKEIYDKVKQTNLERYGSESASKSEEVKEKIKNSNREKYGCDYYSQTDEFKNRVAESLKNKDFTDIVEQRKKTLLQKYGVDNISKYEPVKEQIKSKVFESLYNKLLSSDRLNGIVTPMFTLEEYSGVDVKYKFKCNKCENEFMDYLDDGRVPRCYVCNPRQNVSSSIYEKQIADFIKLYNLDIIQNDRKVINPLELDIYIPSKQFAIEFDGLFWHSEIGGNRDKNYHLNKTLQCAKKGIKLIHVFEDEWINKQYIIKSIILTKLNLTTNKIYARNCSFKQVEIGTAIYFLDNNHLQGSINGNHIGLYYNGKLVSLLTYGKPRFNSNYEIEILRFCNKLNTIVIGGMSKLISKLQSNSIITYVDKRFSNGNSYKNSNFKLIGESKPSYYYLLDNYTNRVNRLQFQKHLLKEKIENFDSNLTEWQNMQLSGYDRIWDCGNYIYCLNTNEQ